jgi:hypothetical protein
MPDRVLHTKLDGPGLFLFEVAGQNHYQPAILRSEPTNPHDCNAIAVEISGLKVGYLDRHTAAKLTNQSKRLGFDRIEATCKAKLTRKRGLSPRDGVITHILRGKAMTEELLPDRWEAAHPQAVPEYREQERRDKADMAVVQAARRRVRESFAKANST